jgi:hypothetical protein
VGTARREVRSTDDRAGRTLQLEERAPAGISAARQTGAQDADGPAHAEAILAYADLDPEGLRGAARAALQTRTQVSGLRPSRSGIDD